MTRALALLLTLAGCAPDYVARSVYDGWSCEQLTDEIQWSQRGLAGLEGSYGVPVAIASGNYRGRIKTAKSVFDTNCG